MKDSKALVFPAGVYYPAPEIAIRGLRYGDSWIFFSLVCYYHERVRYDGRNGECALELKKKVGGIGGRS
jgi:hypothetical protein